jgi:WD40 repeat protein
LLAVCLGALGLLWGPESAAAQDDASAEAIAERIRSMPRSGAANNSAQISPDGQQVTTVNDAGNVVVWDRATGEVLQTIPGQRRYIYDAVWAPGGDVLALTSVDGTVELWDPKTAEQLQVLDQFSTGSATMGGGITEARFTQDGRYVALLQRFSPGRVVVWDRRAEREVVRVERPEKLYAFSWGAGDEVFHTSDENGRVQTWSFPEGELVAEQKVNDGVLFDVDAADGILAAGGKGGVVYVLDANDGTVMHRFEHGGFINRVAVVPGRPLVASVGTNGMLTVWNTDTGERVFRRYAHDDNTYWVKPTPNAEQLATVGRDGYARFWDVASGDLVQQIGR